ncbi:hypothetical protein ACFW1A_09460 [Kitasatospora sp. NPDC058965]|uniref:hypothetical protein n=1 Tax=Kitasatospora sp. NPDC058965 TaxID=3346682 RepID=UPI0036B04BF2
MALGEQDLLPGETVRMRRNANAVIDVDEAGLTRFAFDHRLGSMSGLEAIGGRLHLTNYRLVFNAHAFNRLRGRFSILLPTVEHVADVSEGIASRVEVATGTQRLTFVVWGVNRFVRAVTAARDELDDAATARLTALAAAAPAKLGTGMPTAPLVDGVIAALGLTAPVAAHALDGARVRRHPFTTASSLSLAELLTERRDVVGEAEADPAELTDR